MPAPIEIHQDVNAPADKVWAIITDIENAAQTISGIKRVERLDDADGFVVGTRWRETREMFGRSATEEMTVSEIVPGRSYTTIADHDKVHYESTLSVEPTGAETSQLTMRFDAQTSGFLNKTFGAVIGAIMVRSTRKLMQQDLVDIAAAAEG
jgi:carbon monoxide dehydrogenase subunit G